MMTVDARNEIEELKRNIEHYETEGRRIWDRAGLSYKEKQTLTKRPSDMRWKLEERKSEIEKLGLSTKERSALKREIESFSGLQYGSSIGSRDKVVIGFSKKLGKYLIVRYTKFSSFMRNVRGMGSLAGTKDIRSIKEISKRQYDNIMKQEKKPTRRPTGWERGRTESSSGVLSWV